VKPDAPGPYLGTSSWAIQDDWKLIPMFKDHTIPLSVGADSFVRLGTYLHWRTCQTPSCR